MGPVRWDERQLVGLGDEDRVRIAFEAGEDVGSEVVDRADKVLGAHEDVGHGEAEQNCENPSTNEAYVKLVNALQRTCSVLTHTFDCLLWADLDQLGATEGDTADVCEDVVCDYQADRQEEPDHAFKDIVHDEVRLHDDQVKSHVGPSELGELELVVTLLKRANEEDETWKMLVHILSKSYLYCSRKIHTHDVKHERDKAVVCRKRKEHFVHQDDVLEVVDHTLAVKEVHGRSKEVPIEGLGEAQAACS